jgi:D-alanine-D-alanine ligase
MLRLGVVFGSRSVEHEVSVITATQLMRSVDRARYELVPLYIDKRGKWWTGESLTQIKTFQNLNLENPSGDDRKEITFSPDPTVDHGVDVIIICNHGGHGEDGTLAGLFELANIPYAAPGVVGAAVAIDKLITKLALSQAGFPVTKFSWLTASDWKQDETGQLKRLTKELKFPLFVKPATLGSSVGITRVKDEAALKKALKFAAEFDDRLVVEEEAKDCIEVNVSVVGGPDDAETSITEQPVRSEDFLTYADKYERGGKKSGGMAGLSRRIPAPISPDLSEKLQTAAKDIWKIIGGLGVARIDFFANPSTEEIFLGEINCPPGSMAFYLWEATGVTYPHLIEKLIEAAQSRQQKKDSRVQSIEVNILQKQT